MYRQAERVCAARYQYKKVVGNLRDLQLLDTGILRDLFRVPLNDSVQNTKQNTDTPLIRDTIKNDIILIAYNRRIITIAIQTNLLARIDGKAK